MYEDKKREWKKPSSSSATASSLCWFWAQIVSCLGITLETTTVHLGSWWWCCYNNMWDDASSTARRLVSQKASLKQDMKWLNCILIVVIVWLKILWLEWLDSIIIIVIKSNNNNLLHSTVKTGRERRRRQLWFSYDTRNKQITWKTGEELGRFSCLIGRHFKSCTVFNRNQVLYYKSDCSLSVIICLRLV